MKLKAVQAVVCAGLCLPQQVPEWLTTTNRSMLFINMRVMPSVFLRDNMRKLRYHRHLRKNVGYEVLAGTPNMYSTDLGLLGTSMKAHPCL